MSYSAPRGNYPNVAQRIFANLPKAAMDKLRILDELKGEYGTPFTEERHYPEGTFDDEDEKPILNYPRLAGLRARLGGLPPRDQWEDAVKEQMAQDEKVRELRREGKKKDIIDLLTRNKKYKTAAEPMNPFDQAWSLLKMPIYETGVPGIRFVTQGADDPNWKEQENVYGSVPTDPTEYPVKQGEIAQMTPGEYNTHVTGSPRGPAYKHVEKPWKRETARDIGDFHYRDLMDRAQAGEDILFGMPYVMPDFQDGPPDSMSRVFHDGRHRMSELYARGHGKTPMPVKVMRGTAGDYRR